MHHQTLLATYGGLLHDIGEIAYRSGGTGKNHAQRGYEFLLNCWTGKKDEDRKQILDCVRYHHHEQLKNAELANDAPAWIVYYADNTAAAADRRQEESDSDSARYDIHQPLKPVFTKLNGRHDGFALLPPDPDVPEIRRFLPVPENTRPLNMDDYKGILAAVEKRVTHMSLEEAELNPLLLLLEDVTGTVPSSTFTGEVPDISLYDHAKITAAVSACVSEYLISEKITDYRETLFRKETPFRDRPVFLLYSADVSGIQKFIYTVSIKNALRSLRSRSFFLELAMEHYIDELLEGCGLSRANLLYSGGGHCYLLLPNTPQTVSILETWNRRFNDWLLDAFGIRLYLADGWTACTANDLANSPAAKSAVRQETKPVSAEASNPVSAGKENSPYKAVFRRVSGAVAEKKIHRYSAEQILRINNAQTENAGRECRVCGRTDTLVPDRDAATYVCRWCAIFESLTEYLKNKAVYLLERQTEEKTAVPLPLRNGGEAYLRLTDGKTAQEILKKELPVRLYVRDAPALEAYCTARLNAGVYAAKETLDELAEQSRGIRRLGVCRMDVDNLGAAFVAGFEQPDTQEPYRYATLSRTAAFSRQMSLFFKRYMNGILDGSSGISGSGTGSENTPPLEAALIYSGGDDVFLVGAWNDALEAALRIQRALERFSCGAVTISAGVGMFGPHEPIRMAAEQTARLEDASKDMEGKNAITLFDSEQEPDTAKRQWKPGYTFRWQEFREQVLGEKMQTLTRFFDNPRNGRGKSLLYRILELLRESQQWHLRGNTGKGISLARYAYLLSRLNPGMTSPGYREYKEFSRRMYDWGISPQDRDELTMAIQLYIYRNRTGTED